MKRLGVAAAVAVMVALGFGVQPALAVVIHAEVGDAGDLPATAQNVTPGGPLVQITGTISDFADEDMFRLCLSGGGTFSASTVDNGTTFDTQLFLFDSGGAGVYANDDVPATGFRSTLPSGHALTPAAPGVYFLAISEFDNNPRDAGGNLIFPNSTSGVLGPVDGDAVASWDDGGDTGGTYNIDLTGASACDPETFCAAVVIPPNAITGTAGDDNLVGTPGDDVIVGLGGRDDIAGGGGKDTILGGPGNDRINGEGGDDLICGGEGNDTLDGGSGNDVIAGEAGADRLAGSSGNDTLAGGTGNDRLDGGAGTNANDGGAGTDTCTTPAPPTAVNCSP